MKYSIFFLVTVDIATMAKKYFPPMGWDPETGSPWDKKLEEIESKSIDYGLL